MYERILLPVDHSSHALDAAAFGLAIAGKFDARVTGLYVDGTSFLDDRQERMPANLPEAVRNRLEAKEAVETPAPATVLENVTSQAMAQGAFFRPIRLSGRSFRSGSRPVTSTRASTATSRRPTLQSPR